SGTWRLGCAVACHALGSAPHVVARAVDPEAISEFVRTELAEGQTFDGLFVHHEPALAMLGRALAAHEVACPDAVQVVALSPTDVAMNGPREVSSIDLPIPAIGQTSVAMMLERIE